MQPYFNKLMKRKWLNNTSEAFPTIMALLSEHAQKLGQMKPEPYQVRDPIGRNNSCQAAAKAVAWHGAMRQRGIWEVQHDDAARGLEGTLWVTGHSGGGLAAAAPQCPSFAHTSFPCSSSFAGSYLAPEHPSFLLASFPYSCLFLSCPFAFHT